jgi:ribonuclease HI
VLSVTIKCDGGARPSSGGPAGAGVQIFDDSTGQVIAEFSEPLGFATSNQAEYRALIIGLEQALKLGARRVNVRADSQLVIRQVLGQYAVRDAGLKPLHKRVMELLEKFESRDVQHIPRKQNKRADELATAAVELSRGAAPARANRSG